MEAVASGDSDAVAAPYAEQAILHHPPFPEPARGRATVRAADQELLERAVLGAADHDLTQAMGELTGARGPVQFQASGRLATAGALP